MIIKGVSSCSKILFDKVPDESQYVIKALKGTRCNFQAAIFSDTHYDRCGINVTGELKSYISIREVAPVAVKLPQREDADDGYVISQSPCLLPDVLLPFKETKLILRQKQWTAVWFTVVIPDNIAPKDYLTKIEIVDINGEVLCAMDYTVSVIDISAAESDLVYTNWVHFDCIADKHDAEVFSDKYYYYLEKYILSAVAHGQTMLYVPLFTPPLDTAVGSERTTVQTVGVIKNSDGYEFDFAELKKYIALAKKCGVKYFEFSHLFTQWGAAAAPKIMAKQDGKLQRIFGWDTKSDGGGYMGFLAEFLPKINDFVKRELPNQCYLHLSDEPNEKCIDVYEKLSSFVKPLTDAFILMDAMSEADYAERKLVDVPVVSLNAVDSFKDMEHWVYYCCAEYKDNLTNRFIAMPALRTRVLGVQLYLNGVKGFLHGGFNFYNSFLSLRKLDPYFETDAGGTMPSGDPFIVYPSADGPIDSLRHEILSDAFTDYRELKTLECLTSRGEVVELIRGYGFDGYKIYPKDERIFQKFKDELYNKIQSAKKI